MFKEEKKLVCQANKSLYDMGLVKWTSGNVSLRIDDKVIIKPSGVSFDDLKPEMMVVTDLDGNVVDGDLKASVDLQSHLYVYKNNSSVKTILHTHSNFATTFSILGENIPVLTTTHANVFGGEIPVSDYVTIGEDAIGEQIIKSIEKNNLGNTLLIRNHGVFVWGEETNSILKKAVILEEIAEYSYFALLKNPNLKSLDKEEIARANDYYAKNYGQ